MKPLRILPGYRLSARFSLALALLLSVASVLIYVNHTRAAGEDIDMNFNAGGARTSNRVHAEATIKLLSAAAVSVNASPTIGNYPNAQVTQGAESTITPDAAPANATGIHVATSNNFQGTFAGDPATGVVRVTNAAPAGTYAVTVRAFNGTVSTSKTFPLTVQAGTACASALAFTSAADLIVGTRPYSVAVGDFNSDGIQDLAVANLSSKTVSIRLGDGLGNFSGATNASVGSSPQSVAVGDFNNDGKQDVATANSGSSNVSILLGDGAGGFSGATNVSVGTTPRSVAVGDFNGDGLQDIAVANATSNTVSIRLGDGLGGFSGSTNAGVGASAYAVAVGDFNNDGKQDIACANQGSNSVSILLGDGAGGVSGATNVGVGSTPVSVAVGDFNRDGKQDIAVANIGSNSVSIRLGDGLGGFSGSTNVGVGTSPYFVVIGDFNNDGIQDFAVSNNASTTVSIRLGDGLGGFSGSTELSGGSNPYAVAVGDFNNDGRQDIAVTNFFSNTVTIRLADVCSAPLTLGNYPNSTVALSGQVTVTPDAAPTNATSINVSTSTNFKGTFSAGATTGVVRVTNAAPAGAYAVKVTAFDGTVSTTRTFTLTVQAGTACAGPLAFTNTGDASVGSGPFSVAVGDFNGDGIQDIAVANSNSNTVSIRLGDGLGGFSGSTNVGVGASPFSVAAGDFNGDGKQDIAVANTGSSTVSIRLGDGLGGFSGATNVSVGSGPLSVAIGDFNNDGKQDIAAANASSATVSIRLGDGAGNFSGSTNVSVGATPISVAIGDFNNDGKQDIAAANESSNTVSIRLGDGLGGFTGSTNVGVGSGPLSVAIGDFNNDGKQDLAVVNEVSTTVSIRLGDGAGGFGGTTNISIGSDPVSVAIGDFNNDGKQDIAVAHFDSNTVSIRLGDGAGNFGGSTSISVGSGPRLMAVGDFNGDGKQDIAVANNGSTTVSIRLGAVCSSPTASGGNIVGQIADDSGLPIEGAVVRLDGSQTRKTITDANGNYRFSNVETTGFYTVTPSRVNYNFSPFSRSLSQLGSQTEAVFGGSFTGDSLNPLDTPEYFVRQQYVDVLGREPDEAGFNFWSDRILVCGNDVECIRSQRVAVAAEFFIQQEFQRSGVFIYNLYQASLGRQPTFAEYAAARQSVVGGYDLENATQAFAESFVQQPEFIAKFQANSSAQSFVDALLVNLRQTLGVDLSNQRDSLIAWYESGANQTLSRAVVLRDVMEQTAVRDGNYNAAFVFTEYLGYLRRDPDQAGYDFWLNVLNDSLAKDAKDPRDYDRMVCSFITSTEYQQRFSAVLSHANRECGP